MPSFSLLGVFFGLVSLARPSIIFNNDALFSEQGLTSATSDSIFSPSNQIDNSLSPFTLNESPQEDLSASNLLGQNADSLFDSFDDDLLADSSFGLVDCSSPSNFLALGKSRVRRGGFCENSPPASSSSSINADEWDEDRLREAFKYLPGSEARVSDVLQNPSLNALCYLLTGGVLPWDICSSGDPADEQMTGGNGLVVNAVPIFIAFTLTHCTLGMF